MNYKELGEYVIIRKTEFQKYEKAYDKYEQKKKYSREYMSKKYNEKKQARLSQLLETHEDPFKDPEFMFQFKHIS